MSALYYLATLLIPPSTPLNPAPFLVIDFSATCILFKLYVKNLHTYILPKKFFTPSLA